MLSLELTRPATRKATTTDSIFETLPSVNPILIKGMTAAYVIRRQGLLFVPNYTLVGFLNHVRPG